MSGLSPRLDQVSPNGIAPAGFPPARSRSWSPAVHSMRLASWPPTPSPEIGCLSKAADWGASLRSPPPGRARCRFREQTRAGISRLHRGMPVAPTLAYLVPDNHNLTGRSLPAPTVIGLCDVISETRTRTVIDETPDRCVARRAGAGTGRRPMCADLLITVGSVQILPGRHAHRLDLALNPACWPPSAPSARPSTWASSVVEQLAAAWLHRAAETCRRERREILGPGPALDPLAHRLPGWRPLLGTGGMSGATARPGQFSDVCRRRGSVRELPPGPRFWRRRHLERFVRISPTCCPRRAAPPSRTHRAISLASPARPPPQTTAVDLSPATWWDLHATHRAVDGVGGLDLGARHPGG